MAVTTVCVPPSEALGVVFAASPLGVVNNLMGGLAERLIEADYLSQRPGVVFADHYFDNPVTSSYIAFLAVHNAHLRTPAKLAQLAILSNMPGGGLARPDILTDQAMIREYYEIKPESAEGSVEGKAKLMAIQAFMALFGCTYIPGVTLVPGPSIPMASGTIPTIMGGVPFQAYLSVRRTLPGLLQYSVCVKTDFVAIGASILAIIAAIIAAILLKGARLPTLDPMPTPVIA
jgi:hypothetical protein